MQLRSLVLAHGAVHLGSHLVLEFLQVGQRSRGAAASSQLPWKLTPSGFVAPYCCIGCTRIMVAQGLDGLLPGWFSRISPRWKTPLNAHVAYFLAALPGEWGRGSSGLSVGEGDAG